ncbi:hypothetical protein LJY25_14770 [Hymenobacter sp. BT175]|uniref:hypothetical protein n=1 Tax=Hymenobacter translucens TaxID=2886507 RepID=UPI001D0E5130|nr:hypothetical protein [Hymenobacter translucens]MCC2547716.1 hypothetical protein [Hymenobacter translucens]
MIAESTFENLGVSIGGKLVYCSNSIGLDLSTDEIEASCKRTGLNKNYLPGAKSATAKADGVMTVATNDASGPGSTDATNNYTSENIIDAWQAGTIFDFTWGSDKPGEPVYACKGFFTSVSASVGVGEVGSYSTTIRLNLPLVKTINPE